jgi:hypothetical protein
MQDLMLDSWQEVAGATLDKWRLPVFPRFLGGRAAMLIDQESMFFVMQPVHHLAELHSEL